MKSRLICALIAAIPLLLTPALIFSLAEGWLNLGGGEKDILLAFPYFLWACVFFITSLVLVIKGWSRRRLFIRAGVISLAAMLVLAVFAYVISWFGIA